MKKPSVGRTRRSRIAGLGKPFLVTVSLGAPVVGCTSTELEPDHYATNPPMPIAGRPAPAGAGSQSTAAGRGAPLPTGPGNVMLACPEGVPSEGEPCQQRSGSCDYGDCDGIPTMQATCDDDGVWRVAISSCNPPQPLPCPESLPIPGDACAPTEPALCTYGLCEPGVECIDGAWALRFVVACNPPEPDLDGGL